VTETAVMSSTWRPSVGDRPAPGGPHGAGLLTGAGREPSSSLGHRLRTLAVDCSIGRDPGARLALLAPAVERAFHEMDGSLLDGASVDQVAAACSRLADDAVADVSPMAALLAGVCMRTTQVTSVAIGAYGRRALPPRAALELLMLPPDEAHKGAAAQRMASRLRDGLHMLGLKVACTVATGETCMALVPQEPAFRVGLWSARYLAGPYYRWAKLEAQLDARWRPRDLLIARL
jgi:UTP:GlnB (protein PII) uridylyltransferase